MNKTIKEQYLDECEGISNKEFVNVRVNSVRSFFKKIKPYEDMIGTDFCNFTTEVAKSVIENVCTGSMGYIYIIMSELTKYVDWCIENGFSDNKVNPLQSINTNSLNFTTAVKTALVKDEEQLFNILKIGLQDDKDETIDIMYKCIYFLVYNGYPEDEVEDILMDDINILDNERVIIKGIEYKSEYLVKSIKKLTSLSQFNVFSGRGAKPMSKADSRYLISFTTPRGKFNKNYIRQKLSYLNQNYISKTNQIIKLNLSNIRKSGLFHKVYEMELLTGIADFKEFSTLINKGKEKNSVTDSILSKLKVDYRMWKEAYYKN